MLLSFVDHLKNHFGCMQLLIKNIYSEKTKDYKEEAYCQGIIFLKSRILLILAKSILRKLNSNGNCLEKCNKSKLHCWNWLKKKII